MRKNSEKLLKHATPRMFWRSNWQVLRARGLPQAWVHSAGVPTLGGGAKRASGLSNRKDDHQLNESVVASTSIMSSIIARQRPAVIRSHANGGQVSRHAG